MCRALLWCTGWKGLGSVLAGMRSTRTRHRLATDALAFLLLPAVELPIFEGCENFVVAGEGRAPECVRGGEARASRLGGTTRDHAIASSHKHNG
jgi:hypothetical protein